MNIEEIRGATRMLGEGQGYIGLPVRDSYVHCTVSGPETPCMSTAWKPTPEELERLNKGEPVILRVIGYSHPPVMIYVGDDEE